MQVLEYLCRKECEGMLNNYEELLKKEEARIHQQEKDKVKENPLISQLKAEFRRIKKERC